MQPRVLKIDASHPQPALIAEAAASLADGDLVAFPTETVYGLGAGALDPTAIRKIFLAKGRPLTNPLIVHVCSLPQARSLTSNWPQLAERLARQFWPGPLSIVLPRASHVPDEVTAGGPTVAIRWPAHPVAEALLAALEQPVAAPSANRSLTVSPTTAAHVVKSLGDKVTVVLDAGPTARGLESTVVDLCGDIPRVLRPGPISRTQLETALGLPVEILRSHSARPPEQPLRSPGMLERHYAPAAPVTLRPLDDTSRSLSLGESASRVGWLTFDSTPAADATCLVLSMPRDAHGYAASLYAALHALDDAGVERIVVDLPPTGPEWEAIHDRLRRAASAL